MGGTGVIDNFLGVFTRYIDSGFGLLGGEVAFIATTLIVIDVTLAALFWSLGRRRRHHRPAGQEDAVRRRLRLHHRQLEQSRPHRLRELRRPRPEGVRHRLHRADLMRPGKVAQTGLDAGRPCSNPSPT
jgi:type IV secretion system protein TrbL